MKTFYILICLLIFALSQQTIHAQQSPVTEPRKESAEGFVKLGMPLEEALTKITFIVTWLSGDGSDEVIFEGEGVTREKDYIQLRRPIKRRWTEDVYGHSHYTLLLKWWNVLKLP
ncbi:hypothetical protein F4X88_07095 [Candidatus Poribacteria bacterium]|nr:hypothetical protein [Candidatus Poribacteria bacterium]MYA56042.1 hypothetical protein [Candidatus Poribacteria bacterium]